MKKIKALIFSFLMTLACMPAVVPAELVQMADSELSSQSGQALFMMDKIVGNGTAGSSGKGQTGIAFYKMGLDAEVEINANIKKLQLGCGGINGPGCDIDIDNLSLSGSDTCTGGRANCDAKLTRPFVQFAIENDNNLATRRIVGWRLSAEKAVGILTAGYQDAASSEAASNNGIRSLSGYMNLNPATGTATTATRQMCYATSQCTDGSVGLNHRMTGRLYANLGIAGTKTTDFYSDTYQLTLASAAANVTTNAQEVYGRRMTSVNLTGSATIDPVNFSGTMAANVNGIFLGIDLELNKTVTGTITGLQANVPITQSLGLIHRIPVNNPFSLSLQQQDLLWPSAAKAALRGWWMAFEDPINIGSISPSNQVAMTNKVLLQALTGDTDANNDGVYVTNNSQGATTSTCAVPSINCVLYRGHSSHTSDGTASVGIHGVDCLSLNACLSGSLPIGTLNVPITLDFPLTNLKLSAQSVIPNCFGTSKFC